MPFDCECYRPDFPVTRSLIYLNHAAITPLPLPVFQAMAGLLEDVREFGALHYEQWRSAIETTRQSVARLINANASEVAFVKNTSEGISFFALGLEWKAGDEVVSIEGEFPANFYPWKMLESRGVRVHLAPQPNGEVSLDLIDRAMTPRTKAVAVSFVQFLSGHRLDLARLGRLCANRKVLLFVDAIQGLGAFPVDVKQAQIAGLAADAHKWLLGPEGCGVFYVRQDLLERMTPRTAGWMSVEGWEEFGSRELIWRKDGGRFEGGAANTAGIYGLHAAISLLEDAGIEQIAERVLYLTNRLRSGLTGRGYKIYGPADRRTGSGIVSFSSRAASAEDVTQRLQRHHVIVSARRGLVRISPHFYNTDEEIDRVLELLGPA